MLSMIMFAARFPMPVLHVLPLCLTIAMVYAATRYENVGPVIAQGIRLLFMTLLFLVVVAGILYAIDTTF